MGMQGILEQLTDLKLGELLETPPPGLDEALALAKVVEFVNEEEYAKFTRIVFDTAPTGHTLRLLSLPAFLDNSIAKLLRLRKQVAGASSFVRVLFQSQTEALDAAVTRLEQVRANVQQVAALFRDAEQTEFIIATIPTVLAANESRRLLATLREEGIPCKRIVVNQIVAADQGPVFLASRLKDQNRALELLEKDASLAALARVHADLVDVEVRGIPALLWFGQTVWGAGDPALEVAPISNTKNSTNTNTRSSSSTGATTTALMAMNPKRKFYMFGGKGGVGKTSLSSSLAVSFAAAGHSTLIVSTDPAHSLSDALDLDVTGGQVVRLESPSLPPDSELCGLQVDIEGARRELKDLAAKGNTQAFEDALRGLGMGAIAEQIRDLQLGDLLDSAPPGVDEAVAISQVVKLLRDPDYARFDRIVFDTAPTGHTLRLLTLPDFLDQSVGKIIRLRKKVLDVTGGVAGFLSNAMGGGGGGGDGTSQAAARDAAESALQKLETLKERMEEARALFRDPETTEFVIVTIPTVMAVTESGRLARALAAEDVPVRRIVVNQRIPETAAEKFIATKSRDQTRALQLFREGTMGDLEVVTAPLLDLEVRGVGGLRYFGGIVWGEPEA